MSTNGSFKLNREFIPGVIYLYTNKINGKVYIGQTIGDEENRKKSHRLSKDEYPFHCAIRKYGWDNFEYKVIFKTSTKLSKNFSNHHDNLVETRRKLRVILNAEEKYFIRKYKATNPKYGYNISEGGYDGEHFTPVLLLDLTGNLINEFPSVKSASKETGFSEASIKIHCSGRNGSNHVDKEGRVWLYKHQYENLKHIFPLTNNYTPNGSKEVVQLDRDGNFICEFSNIKLAAENIFVEGGLLRKTLQQHIALCCDRKPRKGGKYFIQEVNGYRWMWKEDWIKNSKQAFPLIQESKRIPINSRTVIMDPDSTNEIEFDSMGEAVDYLFPDIDKKTRSMKTSQISDACDNFKKDGSRCSAFNHTWKYKYSGRNDKNLIK